MTREAANSQYGPEFELETKYLMKTPNHGKNTAYIYCVTKRNATCVFLRNKKQCSF